MTDEPRKFRAYPSSAVTCVDCRRRRDVFSISRSGGGTYRRGGRSYSSSICGECAVDALPYCSTHSMATHRGFSVDDLFEIVAFLTATAPEQHPGAADALAGFVERKDADLARQPSEIRQQTWQSVKDRLGL